MTTALSCITELGKNALSMVTIVLMLKDIFGYRLSVRKDATAIAGVNAPAVSTEANAIPAATVMLVSAVFKTSFISLRTLL